MKYITEFLKQNRRCFSLVMILWGASFFAGMIYACKTGDENCTQVKLCTQTACAGGIDFKNFLLSSFTANSNFAGLLFLFSLFIITFPLTLGVIGFKGFATGFTSTALIRVFGFRGSVISLFAVVIPQCIISPVIFAMMTFSVKYQSDLFKLRKNIKNYDKKKILISYIPAMLTLFLILCIWSFVEALFLPGLLKLIN